MFNTKLHFEKKRGQRLVIRSKIAAFVFHYEKSVRKLMNMVAVIRRSKPTYLKKKLELMTLLCEREDKLNGVLFPLR